MKLRLLAVCILSGFLVNNAAAQSLSSSLRSSSSSTSLIGNIVTLDGHPVDNAQIEIRDLLTGAIVSSCFSTANGSFSLYDVPAGRYEVRAVSGLRESRESIQLTGAEQQITMRMAATGGRSNSATVSITDLKVPGKARKEYEKASELFAKHKLTEAREHCQQALAVAPNYAHALTLTALLDLSEDKLPDAAQKAEQSIQADSSFGLGYVVLATVYNSMGRFEDALRALDRGLPLTGNSWQAHFEMAKALLGTREFARALASLDRAGQAAPKSFAAQHMLRARILIGLNQFSDAHKELQAYISADPSAADRPEVRKALVALQAHIAGGSQ